MPPPAHPQHPALTPALCTNPTSLRRFFALSRAATDDPISQHLSSLNQPSQQPFDPASFSSARASTPARRSIPESACAAFVTHTLFPAWAARARVLEYCAGVAETEIREELARGGGNGKGRGARQWGGTVAVRGGDVAIGAGVGGSIEVGGAGSQSQSQSQSQRRDEHSPTTGPVDGETYMARQKLVDERLDPYSARDYTDETAGERIARVVREEKTVEAIVRARSWGVVRDRCGSSVDDWEDGMRRWEAEMRRRAARGGEGVGDGKEGEVREQGSAGGWRFWH